MGSSEAVRAEDRFDDLGVDSLLSLDLIDAMNSSIGVSLPTTILIDCPTIEMLIGYLVREVDRAATAS